jgi:hypothetical protein
VTLSMQSLDPETLRAVERSNIKLGTYQVLQQRFTRDRIETYADLILGLPNETYDSFVDGVSQLIEYGQHNRIQFNNLSVLPNAPMADPDSLRRYDMALVDSPIVNIHGSLADADEDIVEHQPLVIATSTMPSEAWRRTRAFSWMTALLHFDKVFQIPIVMAHTLTGVSYRRILEGFAEGDLARWPVLDRVRGFFRDYAYRIQEGAPEYVRSERFLNIYWPADEFMLIQLLAEGQIDAFYEQASAALAERLGADGRAHAPVLAEAARLNHGLLKRPFTRDLLTVPLRYNVWEVYRGALVGERLPLVEKPATLVVDRQRHSWSTWDDYCREVIWYGNKKGAYLYDYGAVEDRGVEQQLAGIY